jgi:DNA-binding CsgD family transcriptional regulator/tetratricopeptide (TPR) repeat protein
MASRNALFGRERELRFLDEFLRRHADAPAVLISGEAGIGKTALLRYARACAEGLSFQVLKGHCYDSYETGPYFPFFQALGDTADEPVQEFSSVLPSVELGEAGSSWLGADTKSAQGAFIRELSEVFISMARNAPVLLTIDDIQWSDANSLLLLNCLCDLGVPGLLVLLSERSDEPARAEQVRLQMALRAKAQSVDLLGIDLDGTKAMVTSELGPGEFTAGEVQKIAEVTRGNPLFIQELLRHFRRYGKPSIEYWGDFFRGERLAGNLGSMLDLRLGRLPPQVSCALKAAAVLHGPFTVDMVAHIAGEDRSTVAEACETAHEERLVERLAGTTPKQYAFIHELYAKRFYERLSEHERREYHAKAVEGAKRGQLMLAEGELVRHAALCSTEDTAEQTIIDCTKAAEKAEALLAFDSAASYWQLALEASSLMPVVIRADLYRRLGWASWASGRSEQALIAWAEAAALFDAAGEESRLGEVALALADLHRWRTELGQAKHWATRAIGLPLSTVADRALAAALVGDVLAIENRHSEAREHLSRALDLWHEGGCHPSVAWWLGHGLLMVGDIKAAREVGEQGIEEARKRGAVAIASLIASGLLFGDLGMLNIDAARTRLTVVEEGTNAYDSIGRISLLVAQTAVLGYSGKWQKALELTEEWIGEFRLAGPYQVATARMTSAASRLALGEPQLAEDLIARAMPSVDAMAPGASLYLADALIRQKRLDEARSLVAGAAKAILGESRLAASRALLGLVVAALADEQLARACYESLQAERRQMVMVYSCTSVQRSLGRLATTLRNYAAAIRHFEEALQRLHAGEAWSELAWTLADYAEMRRARRRRGDDVKADGLEARATQLFTEVDMWNPILRRPAVLTRTDPFGLSSREVEVMELLARGKRNREIAEDLIISERTVQRHLENIFEKMHVDGRTEAVVKALEVGVLCADQLKAETTQRVGRMRAT